MAILGTLAAAFIALASPPEEDVHAKWRDYLVPKAEECTFESVGWRGTFWSAVLEAQQKRKPILLWAMNGHPLACT